MLMAAIVGRVLSSRPKKIDDGQTIRDLLPSVVGRTVVSIRLERSVDTGKVTDDSRIEPRYLLSPSWQIPGQSYRFTHLGRQTALSITASLGPVAERMRQLTDRPIILAKDVTGVAQHQAEQLVTDKFSWLKMCASMPGNIKDDAERQAWPKKSRR